MNRPSSYPDVSLLMKMCAQRKAGRRQRARRLADLVFKMAGSLMADEFEIFRNEFRPVHVATLENKIACPHPVCEEAVFLQRAGLQQHYRIRHPEVIFLPKIEDAAGCLMQKLHARETRNILLELFEKRSGQVVFTY